VPDAAAISDAVAAARASGLDAALRIEGDLDLIDPITGLSLHRVVEEALANARRHAPRAVTDVVLAVGADTVVLSIGSVGPLAPASPPNSRPGGDGPRYGLIGMRERMAAVGGEFEAGPTATGWLVRCQAPLTPAVDG
jgi:signal transduction histidine kinase